MGMTQVDADTVIKNGTVVSHDGRRAMDVAIKNGKFVAVGEDIDPGGADVIDARGLLILPGLVDVHTHMRDPGMTEKEDFFSGTAAAAAGGVTTIVDMPNTYPPIATADRFAEKLEIVSPKANVDFGLYGMIAQDNASEITGMAELGAMGLKLFMGQTTGDNPCPTDDAIFLGLEAAAENDLVVGVHAENDHVLKLFSRRLKESGRTDPRAQLLSRPAFIEVEAVTRIVTLATEAGAKLHIHHLSTADGVQRIISLRSEGHVVSIEALVAHLLLDDSAYEKYGNLIKLNPPIRPRENVDALWQGIRSGAVDVIATDHAPHTADEQAADNVWDAFGGFIGVETMLPLMLTAAAEGRLSIEDVVRTCSYYPARRWSMAEKGAIAPGFDADFVVVDPDATHTLRQSDLQSTHPVSPYDGWTLTGKVEATYLRGQKVFADGRITKERTGRQVRPARRPVVASR